jgi:O-antigen/teichoic acid export membrane protein
MQWWAVIVAVVANISLVQWIGMAGAALATVLSQIVFLGLMGMRILRELDVRYLAMRLGIGCCGCMTMYAAFWYFSASNLVFLIPLAIATYILTIIGFRAVRDGELAEILELLGYLSTSRKA